eukprot:181527_1
MLVMMMISRSRHYNVCLPFRCYVDKLYIGASITTENKYGHWPTNYILEPPPPLIIIMVIGDRLYHWAQPTGGLSLGTVYSYDIVYKNTDSGGSLTVTINDEIVYDNANWGHHCISGETCQGVPVAEATPIQLGQQDYYGALDGTVSNIKIYDCDPAPTLYENPGPITPAVNSADLTAIPIRDCMRYKLDVVINAWCTHGSNWCAIMHVGNDDDISKQEQRMPSLSLLRDKLYIGASITTENKYGHWPPTGGLSLGTVYSYDIVYKNTDSSGSLTVTINDEVVYDDVNWGHHCVSGETCQDVPVAEATPIQLGQQDYYGALDGTVSNIKIYDC